MSDEFQAEVFGQKIGAKGAVTVVVVAICAAALGFGFMVDRLGHRLEERMMEEARARAAIIAGYMREVTDDAREESRRRQAEHKDIIDALRRLACWLKYTPEERARISKAEEKYPALAGAWCP